MNKQLWPGVRIRWFRYSHDMIIMDGGYGTVIDIEVGTMNLALYVILKDGGELEIFSHRDLDLLEYEERGDEN
jgi:hypothetical protein